MTKKKLFIIDAMAMAFRSYHAFAHRQLQTSEGLHTSAVFGSAMYLHKLIQEHRPDFLVIACDAQAKTFRHDLFPEYKAHRKPMPEELREQLPYLFELFEAMPIPCLRMPGFEADDIIGSMVKTYDPDIEKYIVSGDKDFLQLVDGATRLYVPQKGGEHEIRDGAYLQDKYGLTPEQVIDLLALMGDAADNVPGVKGVGEKGALKLLAQFGSLEGIYAGLAEVAAPKLREKLSAAKDAAFLSQKLVTIKCDLTDLPPIETLACTQGLLGANAELYDFYQKLEFTALARRVADSREDQVEGGRLAPVAEGSGEPVVALAAGTSHDSYHCIADRSGLDALINKLTSESIFCFDTETTGLDIRSDTPIGLAFGFSDGQAYYLPLIEKYLTNMSADDALQAVVPFLLDPKTKIIGHNIKFDYQMMRNLGVTLKGAFIDTMVISHLVSPDERGHGLDACCLRWLNYKKITTASLLGKGKDIDMLAVPLADLATYACEDADLTFKLYERLWQELTAASLEDLFSNIEMPLIPILANMEHRGIFVDREHLGKMSETLATRLTTLTAQIEDLAGEPFNLNSPKQLGYILYEKMRLPEKLGVRNIKKTKAGYSTDVSMLEKLRKAPIVEAILEYRTLSKLKSTYTDALPSLVHPETNRVHTSFQQTVTATGRLSSTQPNLQNIPVRSPLGREIRKAFGPENPDYRIVAADYSQVELRMLAHLADEATLAEAFANDEDIHTKTASLVFGVDMADVTGDQRSQAKAINFGLIYGMGANRLARQTGTSPKEAKAFIDRYFASYPRIKAYIDEAVTFARGHEYVQTIAGRRRPLPQINKSNRMAAAASENMAVNTPIQGSAADLIKKAMIEVQKRLDQTSLRATMLLQVHDELIFECHKDDVTALSDLVQEAMESAWDLKVPLRVDVGSGNNWLEAH